MSTNNLLFNHYGKGEPYKLPFTLDFFLVHIPEALVLLFVGLSLYGIPIQAYGYKAYVFGLIYALFTLFLSVYDISFPFKILVLFVLMILMIRYYLRESLALSVGITASAFILLHGMQFLLVSAISFIIGQPSMLTQHSWTQICFTWLILILLVGIGIVLMRNSFNIRNWLPQSVQNRYLAIIILFGSIELLSILTLNINYLVNLAQPDNSTGITYQLPFFHVVVLVLFVLIIILLRIYLNLTIHQVEHETPTPYIQNLNDLFTAIRSIKHDAVNHYTAINGLVKLGSNGLATDYVKQLIKEASSIITVVEGVKNPMVSALLHSKMAICIANRISLSVSVTSSPQFRFVKSNELVAVMSNLLDHSIRAALDEAEEERFIRMIWQDEGTITSLLIEHSGQLILPSTMEETAQLTDPARPSKQIGLDLTLLNKFVNRHKGKLQVTSEQGLTRIVIRCK
ncbi:sensor histidine kinase [Brevibacillus ginsengisoli]|uniref:sensor histidine kinase n=1 Tax=Brevibacillus ginsengisoli TaxID=363854 RepID=UPI003CEAD7BC